MQSADWPVWLVPILVAPAIGSFLGVLAMRLPEDRGVVLGRSACPSCGATLGPAELVPLLSYAALRGSCRHCGAPIGRAHLLIELAALLVALATVLVLGAWTTPLLVWSGCVLGWAAIVLAWIDWRCLRLPDVITLPLLLLGLGATALGDFGALADHAAAAATGYAVFRLIAIVYRWLRGREGLGAGDAKLLAACGAWLGSAALPLVVLLAAVATLVAALVAGRGRLQPSRPIPFGPGLALAGWGLWLYLNRGF